METNKSDILVLTEFETKYRVDGEKRYEFKKIMEDLNTASSFLYVESDDVYYVKGEAKTANEFLRLRYGHHNENRKELTYKKKLSSTNNIQRTEINVRIDPTEDYEFVIGELCKSLGFLPNFKITKYCELYFFEKATVVFQSVKYIDSDKIDHFIEIEVNEDMEFTEAEAWTIIKEWEKVLEPLGISARNRSRLSLFEMYRR